MGAACCGGTKSSDVVGEARVEPFSRGGRSPQAAAVAMGQTKLDQITLTKDEQEEFQKLQTRDTKNTLKSIVHPESKYVMLQELGRGHFAKVRKVRRKSDGKEFALKMISHRDANSNDAVVQDEVNILKTVAFHPNVVALVDFFSDEKTYYLVMELCEGGDLFSTIVEKGKYTEGQAARSCAQLASALAYIHSVGVTHRDLKPENILLDKQGNIKLADFGLSKIIKGKGSAQMMKTICGTWAYCAPEVIGRHPYTPEVDNWTLGVLMFILLCGYHPFDVYGDLPEPKLLRRIVDVTYDFDDEVWDHVSEDAKDLIRGLLVDDPAKRISLKTYLESKWIRTEGGEHAETKEIPNVVERMEKFNAARAKFRAAVINTIATSRRQSVEASDIKKNLPPEILETMQTDTLMVVNHPEVNDLEVSMDMASEGEAPATLTLHVPLNQPSENEI